MKQKLQLPWLEPGDPFPPVASANDHSSSFPGLLAAGGALDVTTLIQAYKQGIFPWYSEGQPILWWSTDPRMVLKVDEFKLHTSFSKTLKKFRTGYSNQLSCEIRIDSQFEQVIKACATAPRGGQSGTWILPEMISAYIALHKAGYAHSVETWVNNELVGGLYCINIGKAVYGESMFAYATDASKIALAALVCFCKANAIRMIDCQQNTKHLKSLGANVMSREKFVAEIAQTQKLESPIWHFHPRMWEHL